MNTTPRPARVTSPGEILIRELEARGWTQRDLAIIIGRPYQAINEIIKGTKQITPDTARELARAFGTSIDFWMTLETNYRLHLAEQDQKENEIVRRSRLYTVAPVREMIKRSWIHGSDNIDELEQQIRSFFGVSTLEENNLLGMPVNFRFSKDREVEIASQAAWVRRVQNVSEKQAVSAFSAAKLRKALPLILELSRDESLVAQVPARLSELGVRFLIVQHLPKTYIDGAAINSKAHPIVALTLRYDRIDSFWFTLLHELAHIISGHKGILLDDIEQGRGSGSEHEEDEANRLAAEWLIEQKQLANFIIKVRPYFSKYKIEKFAAQLERHPGIILGQLHNKKAVEYKQLRSLLVSVEPYLTEWKYN
jgi:HTH-type transcriptional regulator/antitoxin HigA